MFNKILIAFDASQGAYRAAEVTADLARRYNAPLIALHVYETPPFATLSNVAGVSGGSDITTPAIVDELMQESKQCVREQAEAVLGGYGIPFTFRQENGSPIATITRIAREEQCDVIVIGHRGLSTLESFLLGSVSERVAHTAHCTVIIVR